MDICMICLRTDLALRVIDSRLADFHEELCDYFYYSFGSGDPKFCSVCGHLLRKLYNFKEKCILAINLLQKWNNHKVEEKKTLDILFTLLPQSALGTWRPSNCKLFHFEEQPKPMLINSTLSNEPVLNMPLLTLVPNVNMLKPRTVLKINVSRPLGTSVNVPRPTGTSVNVPRPTGTSVQVPRPSVPSVNEIRPTITSESPIEIPIAMKDIKLEMNCEDDVQVLNLEDVIKTEEMSIPYFEIVPEHKINSKKKKSECSGKNDIQLQIKNFTNTEIVEYVDDTILNDDDIKTDNNLDFTSLYHVKDIESDSSVKSEDILLTDKPLDNSSIDSDDSNDKIKVHKRLSTINKKSLDKQVNACISDDDYINSDEAEIKIDEVYVTEDDKNEEQNTAKKHNTDVKNLNAELDSMNDNYGKIKLQSGNIAQENIIKKNNKCSKQNTEGLKKMFIVINKDMKAVQENCENIIHPEDGPSSIHKRIKVLKENLTAKFKSCGELKSVNGIVIDKEHVLNCIDGRASEFLIDILWKAVDGKKKLIKKAVKILAWIQNKYNKSKYESVFDIEYMNSPEAMKEEIQRRQTYPWYIQARHRCELCYTVYNCEKHLENHKRMHDKNAGDFTCPICGVRHKLKKENHRHFSTHEVVYKCKLCPLVTYYKSCMMNHYDQHKGVKYRCEPCNKTFKSQSGLKTHRGYRHKRDHVCTTCGRTLETEEILNTHKKSHRVQPSTDGSTSVKCDACELTFPSQQVYERHARFTHGAHFLWRRNRTQIITKAHDTMIRKKMIYTCPLCKLDGHSFSWLVLHGRLEHGEDLNVLYAHKRKNLCDVCGKGFTNTYTLRDHMNRHTGVRPYPCELCPKRFHSSLYLKNHSLYHLPPGLLCNHCGKKFHTPSNLYNHMQSHIRDRRFKCNVCGKGFIRSSLLREHIRGVHNNVRRVRKTGGTEAGVRASEPVGSGGSAARGARTSTAARTKRRRMREVVSSTDESSDSD